MEMEEQVKEERLEAAMAAMEEGLKRLEERIDAVGGSTGEVERISATVDQGRREEELIAKMAGLERELTALKAHALPLPVTSVRKTVPVATSEMLAKHGIAEAPVDVNRLDAALAGLSLEQRIAVKTQLLRAGAIA